MKVPFSPPRIDEKIIQEVTNTLQSGWITTGPKTKLLEKKIKEYVDCSEVLCLNSATAGMELMLRWFGVKDGDEVIVPAYTYCATANVVIHCGAKPIMVDVGKDFNIDVKAIEAAITTKTKVIMAVDFGGFPCDYNEIIAIVKREDIRKKFNAQTEEQKLLGRILMMSDSAHSFGAEYHAHKIGKVVDLAVFSFHAVKNLTTAEGGAICLNLPPSFNNHEIYKSLCIRILHGQTKDALSKMTGSSWKYDVIEAGFKCNMTDLQAAIGLVEIERYKNEHLPKRKYIFEKYAHLLGVYEWAELPICQTDQKKSSYHLFPLRIKGITEEQRDRIIEGITAQLISVNVHFIPLPLLSFYKKMGYDIKNYPMAYNNYSREISLPVFFDLTDEQIIWVVEALIKEVKQILF